MFLSGQFWGWALVGSFLVGWAAQSTKGYIGAIFGGIGFVLFVIVSSFLRFTVATSGSPTLKLDEWSTQTAVNFGAFLAAYGITAIIVITLPNRKKEKPRRLEDIKFKKMY